MLVVDDEPAMRLLVRLNLDAVGFDVTEAADAESALAHTRARRFDLILLDVMMPGMSGLELAQRLQREPESAGVPIVFLSARADQADIRDGFAAGAADYITKPFDPLLLGEHLNAVIDGRVADGNRSQLLGGDSE